MRSRTATIGIAVIAGLAGVLALAVQARADDKADIEALEMRVAAGIEARDADAIMANYQPGESLLVFDLIPPRQYNGWDAYKKDWQGVVGGCTDSPKVEISDLAVESEGKLAFSHYIQHFACNTANGKLAMTMRATDVYRKVKGKWLIVHEHLSVPVDLATGKADLSSKP